MKIVMLLSANVRELVGDTPEEKWVEEFQSKPTKMAALLINILEKTPWKKDPKVYNLSSMLFKQVVRGKYKKAIKIELQPAIKKIESLFKQFEVKSMAKGYEAEKIDSAHHNGGKLKGFLSHEKVKIKKKELKDIPKVQYAGRTFRLKAWVSFKNNGTIKTTGHAKASEGLCSRIYVVDRFGQFYISKDIPGSDKKRAVKHSTFFNGEAVSGAGKIYFNKSGKIVKISNSSGHYQPGSTEMRQTLLALRRHGADLGHIKVVLHTGKKTAESIASSWKLQ